MLVGVRSLPDARSAVRTLLAAHAARWIDALMSRAISFSMIDGARGVEQLAALAPWDQFAFAFFANTLRRVGTRSGWRLRLWLRMLPTPSAAHDLVLAALAVSITRLFAALDAADDAAEVGIREPARSLRDRCARCSSPERPHRAARQANPREAATRRDHAQSDDRVLVGGFLGHGGRPGRRLAMI